jgi:hypothetical protein
LLYPLGEAQGVLLLEPEDDPLEDTLELADDDVSEKEPEAWPVALPCAACALRGRA